MSLTIYKDILTRYEVRDPRMLEDLLYLVSEKISLPLSYDAIARSFHLSLETARSYMNYLESAGLVIGCEYYTKNVLKRARRNKKFYIVDPGLNTALNYATTLTDDIASKNVESAMAICIVNHLKETTGLLNPRIAYWKERYEVDFVVEMGKTIIPIEVKYAKVDEKGLRGIYEFMEDYGVKRGLVITKGEFGMRTDGDRELAFIPAVIMLSGLVKNG